MATARSLEARYRRLLAWFPAEYRHAHGDEVVGVLLAAAEPGRDRPSRAESWNLMLSGLRIRLRPGAVLADGDGWRDALAIFSVLMPVLVLAGSCATTLTEQARFGWGIGPLNITVDLMIYGQLLIVPLVLLGLRRWAVVATCVPLAISALFVGYAIYHANLVVFVPLGYGLFGSYVLVAGVLELVALVASQGPRRGRQLLRGRRWAYVAVAAAPAAVVVGAPSLLLEYESGSNPGLVGPVAIVWVTAVIALGLAWLTSALGKRLAVLFAVLACAYLAASTVDLSLQAPRVVPGVLTVLSEIATAVVAVVVVRRVRQTSRS